MEIQEAISNSRLTEGVNPKTRKLKDNSICRNPQAVMALNRALAALGIFTQQDSAQVLRASTYGRGVWEFPLDPDYFLTISNSPITVFAGHAVPPFTGTITALSGYNSYVDLSCALSTCSITPTRVIPAPPPQGTSLTATASVSTTPGDYLFDLLLDFESGGLQFDRSFACELDRASVGCFWADFV